jgi:hypothetical protein
MIHKLRKLLTAFTALSTDRTEFAQARMPRDKDTVIKLEDGLDHRIIGKGPAYRRSQRLHKVYATVIAVGIALMIAFLIFGWLVFLFN